jgi:hypothetical protein
MAVFFGIGCCPGAAVVISPAATGGELQGRLRILAALHKVRDVSEHFEDRIAAACAETQNAVQHHPRRTRGVCLRRVAGQAPGRIMTRTAS